MLYKIQPSRSQQEQQEKKTRTSQNEEMLMFCMKDQITCTHAKRKRERPDNMHIYKIFKKKNEPVSLLTIEARAQSVFKTLKKWKEDGYMENIREQYQAITNYLIASKKDSFFR